MQSYLTIKNQCAYETVIKRSKFIGCSFIVYDEQSAAQKLKEVKSEYGGATHYCYAYILSPDSSQSKYSDDGEPAKTAGYPILQAINSYSLYNTMVVVVRYFGGVKLGTGGLSRAYFDCASGALKLSGIKKYIYSVLFEAVCNYSNADNISRHIEKYGLITERQFDNEVKISAACPVEHYQNLLDGIMQISGGNVEIKIIDKKFYAY